MDPSTVQKSTPPKNQRKLGETFDATIDLKKVGGFLRIKPFLVATPKNQTGSQNWWFGDPKKHPSSYRFKPIVFWEGPIADS